MPPARIPDVVIVGGGAIGLGIAWRLAQRGASVTVLDRGPMAAEASSHATGLLAPLTDTDASDQFRALCLASHRLYPAFVEELAACTGVDVGYGSGGVLEVALDEGEAEALGRRFAWLQAFQWKVDRLDGAALRALEPQISPRAAGALRLASDSWLTPPSLACALTRAASAAGARLRPEHPLAGVERDGPRVVAVRAGGERLAAGRFVIAAGTGSGEVGEAFGLRIPVFPVRGQLIAVEGLPRLLRHAVYGQRARLVPWSSGEIIVSTTLEHAGFTKAVTAEKVAALLGGAMALAPAVARHALRRMWACLRPATPDALPILGRAPGADNLFLATGHYRHGILLTPITASLMAGVVQGEPAPRDLHPFRLDRPSLVAPSAD